MADELSCSECGRAGTAADVAAGWSLSVPPRPVGSAGPRPAEQQGVTALCPGCARRLVRDLEARLDP